MEMPLWIAIIMAVTMGTIISWIISTEITGFVALGCFSTIILLCLLFSLGISIYDYNRLDWEYNQINATVCTIDNTDCAKIDGELLNLNEIFGRDFEDKEQILLKEKIIKNYGGIIPSVLPYDQKYELEN